MRADAAGGVNSAVVPSRTVLRLRAVAVCLALTALAFLQQPGLMVADSKIDLVVNPADFLARALHLWDPSGSFGQLQNQAYGYLWPMGPFFLAGSWLGISGWVIQRLWWALLVCVAYTGCVSLAGRFAIGTPTSRVVAGVAFALSPRILTELGAYSVEAWPMAVAPWVLVPLVGLAKGAKIRPAVTRSALAVACAGGVNATAVLALVPLALIWLAMLQPLRRRLAAVAAWSLAVICATAWWVVPLLILGRYSPPFLDYTETASVTTRITDLVTVVRGASHWVAYLATPYGPSWPTGWRLATETVLVVATIVVAALGFVGLARRGAPHRTYLITCLLIGVGLVGLGHVSALDGTVAGFLREFLDQAGAPLRNTHKFDVVVRLPLVLGLAHFVGLSDRLGRFVRNGVRHARAPAVLVTAMAAAAIAGVALPALAGGLAAPGGFKEVPGYWREATDWLDAHAERDRVLVVPAAQFPNYEWGSTREEITQPLMDRSWAVRNAIPLAQPTTIRLLDAVESALATGGGSVGLADVLARSGVRYLLVRSDLDYGRSAATRPIIVHQALTRSPGLSLVAGFGPVLRGDHPPGTFDYGLNVPVRALEVFRVDRPVDPVVAFDVSDVTTVVGGPESLLNLSAAGQLSAAPAVLAGDLPGASVLGRVAVTDGLRRRDVAFGQLRDNTSATLTADEPFDTPAPTHDFLPQWRETPATTARYEGIVGVRAASSWAQANLLGGSRPEHHAFAAFDGDATTSWRPAPGSSASGQWLEVELSDPQTVPEVRLRFDLMADSIPTKVTVAAGAEGATAEAFGATMVVRLPGVHASRTVRVIIDSVLGIRPGLGSFGISEVEIPGVKAVRTLALPRAPATSTPATVVLAAAPATPGCFFFDGHPRCAPDVARASEDGDRIDRTLTLPAAGLYEPIVWVRPRAGEELNALLDQRVARSRSAGLTPTVTASSTGVSDPVGRPGAVIDGDPTTAWRPALTDSNPQLHMTWRAPRLITGLRLTTPPDVAAPRPGAVRIIGDDGVREGFLNETGEIVFDRPMRTDEIAILLLGAPSALSYDPYENWPDPVPFAIGEVTVRPGPSNATVNLDTRVELTCDSGPTLVVGQTRIPTRISASQRDLLEMREIRAEPCDERLLPLPVGQLRVVASGGGLATPTRLALAPDLTRSGPTATAVRIEAWSATERRVTVSGHAADRIVAVRENANPGWQATMSGRVLTSIVVDGWQQGWLLPSGASGEVLLRFVPDTAYRVFLLGGAVLLGGLLLLAVMPTRRRGTHTLRTDRGRSRGQKRLVPFMLGGAALVVVGGALGGLVVLLGLVAAAYRSLPSTPPRDDQLTTPRVSRTLVPWIPVSLLLFAGWLSLTVENRYEAAGPQLAGVLAVGGLWLSVVIGPSRRPAGAQALEGSLETVVTGRREQEPATHGHEVRARQISGEEGSVSDDIDSFKYEQMPQEQPVRDGT